MENKNEIIKIVDDMPILNDYVYKDIVYIQSQIDALENIISNYKECIKQEMEEKNIRTIVDSTGEKTITIAYVAPTTRESLDTKRLKTEKLDIYNEYCKISEVKSSIRMSVK